MVSSDVFLSKCVCGFLEMMSAKLGGPSFEMAEVGNPSYSPEAYPNQKRIGVMGPNHVATWPPSLPWVCLVIQAVTFLGW